MCRSLDVNLILSLITIFHIFLIIIRLRCEYPALLLGALAHHFVLVGALRGDRAAHSRVSHAAPLRDELDDVGDYLGVELVLRGLGGVHERCDWESVSFWLCAERVE